MKTTVYLVDDHPVTLNGVRHAINQQRDMEVVGQATNGTVALEEIAKIVPNIVVLDIEMPGMSGMLVATELAAKCSKTKIIAMSGYDKIEYVHQMLVAGVSGYVLKECQPSELITAIRQVREGQRYFCQQVSNVVIQDYTRKLKKEGTDVDLLSIREREVLELIADGVGRLDIAKRLRVEPKTVDTHRANVMEKLGLHTIAELTKFAVAQGVSSINLGARRIRDEQDEQAAEKAAPTRRTLDGH